MTTPLQIPCETVADIPSVTDLLRLATENQHVILVVPYTEENENAWKPLVERLEEEMTDHTVFGSGGKRLPLAIRPRSRFWRWLDELFSSPEPKPVLAPQESTITVTLMKILSEADVLSHAEEMFAAAQQFRIVATERMSQLAAHLGVSLNAFDDPLFRMRYKPTAPQQRGTLKDGWTYFFHGMECAFSHPITKQYVDVVLGFPNEFGVLDAQFFAQFIRSTPEWETIGQLFKDDFYYPSRALDVLEKHGYLRRVHREQGRHYSRSGRAARR